MRLLRAFLRLVAGALLLVVIALVLLQTGWVKERIRRVIVRQANQYLSATLTIGEIEGSLVRGLSLSDVRLVRDGRPIIAIDEVALSYSIRELLQPGLVIQRVRLVHPHIASRRTPDGRWDLAALVRRERREAQRTGPGRPIEVVAIEIVDGSVALDSPLTLGAVHVPTRFESLNASCSFSYYPVRWRLSMDAVSWVGPTSELTMRRLAGVIATGPGGLLFQGLSVQTPQSALLVNGRVDRSVSPAVFDLGVRADRFAFQEWSSILPGLRNIAVVAVFDTKLRGPSNRLATSLRLQGTGGSVVGQLTLDTTVPGWRAAGAVDVGRLDLARWLNRPDRPSDITGHVAFDLALELGRQFPRGSYAFDGAHAMYMGYEAANLRARGTITAQAVLIASATARAYDAGVVVTNGSISISTPFPFMFRGAVSSIDLRHLPATVPVPHVESTLSFDYDVSGRFSDAFLAGRADFDRSTFIGATLGAGTSGSVDTSQHPIRYTGEGDISGISLGRFGEALDVGWMRDPRFAGTVSGHFRVDGNGSERATMSLSASGRVERAELFRGVLTGADVSLSIEAGSLSASYSGRVDAVDPAVPFADQRFRASVTGNATLTVSVADLLTRTPTLPDYHLEAGLTLDESEIHSMKIDSGQLDASLDDSVLTISRLTATGPSLDGHGSGRIVLASGKPAVTTTADPDPPADRSNAQSNFEYVIARADLGQLQQLIGQAAAGVLTTTGQITGSSSAWHVAGDGAVEGLDISGFQALSLSGKYDVTTPWPDLARARGRIDGRAAFASALGQSATEVSGSLTYDTRRVGFVLGVGQPNRSAVNLAGTVILRPAAERAIAVAELTVSGGTATWRLVTGGPTPTVSWDDRGFTVKALALAQPDSGGRITVDGTSLKDGSGALKIVASHVFLESIQALFERPARYGGVLDADLTLRGTRSNPLIAGDVAVSNGRVERVTYQRLAGHLDYGDRALAIDLRLDQSPGVSVVAKGTVPLALVAPGSQPEQPIDVTFTSSGINLGLVEGVTSLVRHVSGSAEFNVKATGTSRDPRFEGKIQISGGGFQVAASGATYKNVAVAITLAPDRIDVDALHVEDESSRPLDVTGSLGTRALQIGRLRIDAKTHNFEILRNEFGRVEVNADLQVTGRANAPRVTGDVTISSGTVKVDEILQRALFQPYATEPTALAATDAVAALNPWQRLGLDVSLHTPNTLKLEGKNVQVSPGTPIGLGDFNLRVEGDINFYKDPGDQLYVTGSFDSVSGSYSFQGRRFEIDPTSSIVFRGDPDPELYLTVTRTISAVEARVSLTGTLHQPEIQLSSNPPLEPSDILSLIVFNTSTNQLSAVQQQQLAVRAGALAAGFIATPLLSAIESSIGLETLDVEPAGDFGEGPKVVVGEEIAPGLVARFGRQFGPEPYDEATVEYYLSKILRLRATFSDAQSLSQLSPFRRIERAGLDLLFFFSF